MRYRNPGKWIRELLPNQTKDIPTILLWFVIFLVDVALIFYIANLAGISLLKMPYRMMSFCVLLYCLIAFVLLYAEAKLWDRICPKNKK